ncbi:MAG: GAF domain-containing sensor histidine kinase [Chloroflexi bacterium]|nr:GAF domain-containing sensor histidine kinase [Chloroflexota bacterium]
MWRANHRQCGYNEGGMDELIHRWRQLGVWLPVTFVATASAVAVLGLGRFLPGIGVVLVITALTALGAAAFSTRVFRILGREQRRTERRARELAAINEASLALSSELDLPSLLQRVVDLSRQVTDARYGALAMLDEEGKIAQFLTSGISREERQRMGRLPEGRGLLGVVIREGETLRVDHIAEDPRSSGFPPHHPVMISFIGLPIRYEDRIVGDLYLTNKNGGEPFTRQDEGVLRAFAAHAAIAIENARLYGQVQDLVVLEERDRIGMDLHDGVIQSLYATGLTLENCLEDLAQDPAQVQPQLQQAIERLNQVIIDIRSYIFNLRPSVLAGTDLAGAVGGLLQELKVNALLDVQLIEEPEACRGLSEEQIDALFHVAQESLANVRKHARAASVTARLERGNGAFRMTIADDGVGFDPARPGGGQGLHNMRERVDALGGRLQVESSDGQGARLTIELPLAKEGAS